MKLTIDMPGLRTKTPGNSRAHWRVESRAAAAQRGAAKAAVLNAFNALTPAERERLLACPRLVVRLTRTSPRKMDRHNLYGALKHVIDGIADAMGRDDGDPWYDWRQPEQAAGPVGVRVELEA